MEKKQLDKVDRYRHWLESADEIVASGNRPTASILLKKMGQGSMTTATEALAVWWETLESRVSYFIQYPDLSPKSVKLASNLVKAAREEGEEPWAEALAKKDVELETVKEACAAANQEKEEIQKQLNAARHEIGTHTQQATTVHLEMKSHIEACESSIKDLTKSLDSRELELAAAKKENDKVQGAIEKQMAKLERNSKDLAVADQKIRDQKAVIDDIRLEYAAARTAQSAAEAALTEEKTGLAVLRKELRYAEKELASKDKALAARAGEIQGLQAEIVHLATCLETERSDNKRLTKENTTLEVKLEERNTYIGDLKEALRLGQEERGKLIQAVNSKEK